MEICPKPPVHLWIYNHPFFGISDQVDFFISLLQQHGYPVSVGRQPVESRLNAIIENFSTIVDRETFVKFCQTTGKRAAIIMTEHLDLVADQLRIHGDPLWSSNDYMDPTAQVSRIRHLFECVPYIRAIFVLGDLPKLKGVHSMIPGLDVRWLPFPKITEPLRTDRENSPQRELLFTGISTEYRKSIIAMLKGNFDVLYPGKLVSKNKRDVLNRKTRLVLNIPQRSDWRWLSLMRVIATLRCGRATVSLATRDDSEIAACTYQISLKDRKWQQMLRHSLDNWQTLYQEAFNNYQNMSDAFSKAHPFPYDLFELWAITDRLKMHSARD